MLERAIEAGGLTREYLIYVPPAYSGTEPQPLILNLHGAGSSARNQIAYSGLTSLADREGILIAAPQATSSDARWNFTTVQPGLPDDVAFIGDMLDSLEDQFCIEPTRVFATGISNGAAMAIRLACNIPDRIAAIATVAATYFPASCPSQSPISLLAFHGTDDPVVPYEGGGETPAGFTAQPVEEALDRWGQFNNCLTSPGRTQVTPSVTLTVFEGCDDNASVGLYTIEGGGHTWPGSQIEASPALLGSTTDEISASNLIWGFFTAGQPLAAITPPANAASAQDATPEGTAATPESKPGSANGTAAEDEDNSVSPEWVFVVLGAFAATAAFAAALYAYARRSMA
jgi:polyhydroxybutyrate depolymerase